MACAGINLQVDLEELKSLMIESNILNNNVMGFSQIIKIMKDI